MTKELRRVAVFVLAMFTALFVASSSIQFVWADELRSDQRNVRSLYDSYKTKRGAILVDGVPIAESQPSGDAYFYQRSYSDQMYSSVTGFYSLFQGATGLESAMNTYLTGQNSSQFFEQINALFSGNPITGANVELTIDPNLQKVAYDSLGKLNGAVVAIEPKTGRILAMISKPSYNANLLAGHISSKAQSWYQRLLAAEGNPLLNKATSELYAPGSVFKLVVASAAIQSGNYTVNTKIPNPKRFKLPGTNTYVYNSGEGKCGGKDSVTIGDALRLSCNVPFAQLGIELGQDRISQQAALFGFSQKIEIPLMVEPSIYPANLDDAQTGLSAFGQYSDRVTAVQMAMVSAAIANQGILMQPNLIENVQSSTLSLLNQPKPRVFSQPISEATSDIITEMMVGAVSSGVSNNARIKGVKVAGKTGTAQNGEGEPYTLWFTGFAPADDPQIAVAVVIADGGGMGQSGFGNLLAAPIAKKVMEAVLGK